MHNFKALPINGNSAIQQFKHSDALYKYLFFFEGGGGGGGGEGNATFIHIARSCRIGQYKATIMRYAQLD